MAEIDEKQLKQAVELQHGGTANFVESVPVKEILDGGAVWEGAVAIFDLEGGPNATRAYAWSPPLDGSGKRRFISVLHLGAIRSARDAVMAAVMTQQRSEAR